MEIEKFFDIFENKFENDKIKNIVSNAQLKKASVNEEEAALLLPNYSPMVESFVANNLRKAEDLARINNKGVDYAIRYATGRNREYDDLTYWGGRLHKLCFTNISGIRSSPSYQYK